MDLVRFKRGWLLGLLGLGVLIISLGGLTRLTESGLSIVHWEPIRGLLPPLSAPAWERVFSDYKKSPEGRLTNANLSLKQFKFIYMMEYLHRMLARFIGLWALLPMLWLFGKRALNKQEVIVFPALFGLVLLQGLVGWLMVKSGLVEAPEVSHLRLALHFSLGYFFAGFAAVLLLKTFRFDKPIPTSPSRLWRLSVLGLLLAVQFVLGSMTAGLKAGFLSPTFPKMNGQWIPDGLWLMNTTAQNLLHNPILIVFLHRSLGILLVALALAHYFLFWIFGEPKKLPKEMFWAEHSFLLLLLSQVGLGVLTIVSGIRIELAMLHQFWGVLIMLNWLFLMFRACHPSPPRS